MARSTSKRVADAQGIIADQLEGLPANFLDCRDPGLRHKWERDQDFHVIPLKKMGRKAASIQRSEVCERCGTRKVERFAVTAGDLLEKIGTGYEYPEGYLMSNVGVPRGLKRSGIVWAENYRRAMEGVVKKSNVKQIRKSA